MIFIPPIRPSLFGLILLLTTNAFCYYFQLMFKLSTLFPFVPSVGISVPFGVSCVMTGNSEES